MLDLKHGPHTRTTTQSNVLSNGWGGRFSDKEITIKSGFFSWIENGDQILADRGFTVAEEVATVSCILELPSFTKGKAQLSAKHFDHSRQIANERIHIERVIGRMRKFNILNTTIPISQVDLLDHVMVSIGGLINMCKKIVADYFFIFFLRKEGGRCYIFKLL